MGVNRLVQATQRSCHGRTSNRGSLHPKSARNQADWPLRLHMHFYDMKLSGCCFLSRADPVANKFGDSTTEGKNCVKETALESEKYCKRVHCQPPSSLSLVLDSHSTPTDHFFKTFDVSTRIALVLIFFFFLHCWCTEEASKSKG